MSTNSETWLIDPATGDYEMAGGSPVLDKSLIVPAYIRCRTHRTQWLYAPDNKYGSDFYNTKIKRDTNNAKTLQGILLRALQPMLSDKRALQIKIDTISQTRETYQARTKILEAQGNVTQLTLSPIL